MKVLLSIKPEYATKIFEGSKKYEYRRAIFKRQEVATVVIYASNPVKRIIGEFQIGTILQAHPDILWYKTGQHAGITKKKFFSYFAERETGYAIKIRETKRYEIPYTLNEFMLSWPPQSFIYI
ncbi:MAG: ASCH domain-containing protein [Dehalococcoidia bacterium]